ncbi:MAG: MaoC family dehydratase [Syntrophomonadaceae bacterium]|jgi:3-hydroxybutyryl-CoA dehydratase
MVSKGIRDLNIGDNASFTKTITEYDVYNFAGVTGDMNPMHINHEYAKETAFGSRIAHGILSLGFISNVLGNQIPGPGCIYAKQTCEFKKPVYIGDTITATVEVTGKNEEKNQVWLRTYCTNQKGEVVLEGEALVIPRKERSKSGIPL